MKIKNYISNCFLLLIPVLLWNIFLVEYLPKGYSPEYFDKDIPSLVTYGEQILRIAVFLFPLLMVLSLKTRRQKIGFLIYILGLVIYFMSWIMLIVYPESNWSTSLIGFMAPAFTTLIFFVGIRLIGEKSFINIPYLSQSYIVISIVFVFVHSAHTYIVYQSY